MTSAQQTETLAAIHDHLDEQPGDWQARLELADLMEELGDDQQAACQRWMAANERHPVKHPNQELRWDWWLEAQEYTSYRKPALVSRAIYCELAPFATYLSRQDAEADLLQALLATGEIQ